MATKNQRSGPSPTQSSRTNKISSFTLTPEARFDLESLAEDNHMSLSGVVDTLIRAAARSGKKIAR